MKIENIKFSQGASRRIYEDYMKRVKKATASLSKQDQDDVYMEFNSHIFEALQYKEQANEIDTLLDVLQRLGTPEEVLKPLVADKKLDQATRTFNPIHVFKALVLNLTNGVSYIIFFILFSLLFGFVFIIFAKIMHPSEVGMFFKNDSFLVLGMSSDTNQEGVREVLGNWFIPVMVLCAVTLYLLFTLLLRLKKIINRN